MATQQQAGRAYNIFDIPSVMRYARRQPQIAERDIESENAYKLELIKALSALDQVEADINEGRINAYTEQQKALFGAYGNALQLLGTVTQAQASTRSAYGAALSNLNETYNNAMGVIRSGAPTEEFSKQFGTAMTAPTQSMIVGLRNREFGDAGATSQLFAEMLGSGGGAALYDQDKFDDLVNALDQLYVTGPSGMVKAYMDSEALTGGSGLQLEPNAIAARDAMFGAIGTAINELGADVPQQIKENLYRELSSRGAIGIMRAAQAKNASAFTKDSPFMAKQAEANQYMENGKAEIARAMSVGVDKKERDRIMRAVDAMGAAITEPDPMMALAVAERQLADQGIARPPEGAPQEQQDAYTKALTAKAADIRPMETFAERMGNFSTPANIAESRKFLRDELAAVGKVAPDPLASATEQLKASTGDAVFAAWKQMTGAQTDEDAAVLAANDPTKFAVFKRAAQADTKVLTNPRQYATAIGRQAATEKATARQEARAAAPETVAGTAPQTPSAPTEPEATKKLEETQQPSAAVERRKAAFEEEEGEVAQYQPPEEAAAPAPIEPFKKIREAIAQAEPLFGQRQAGITSQRAQLFGAGGLMAQRARGA